MSRSNPMSSSRFCLSSGISHAAASGTRSGKSWRDY
jgi:hypothetical protein